ncbi:MAG TPA: transposase [Bacteroidales bacterium]|nr:transposase [Bacteroidales bacterium]
MSTYSQIYIQIVFAVQGRDNIIKPEWENRLYQYIAGFIRNKKQKLLAINGTSDHLHILIGMLPSCCLCDLIRELKKSSNAFIKENRLCKFRFNWQEGFGAFSYNKSQIDDVIKYIMNQKVHHREQTFRNEFVKHLEENEIDYEEKYLPEFYD